MATDNRTPNLNLPLPDFANNSQDVDIPRIVAAFMLLDAAHKALADLAAGKAASAHIHTIEQITGLVSALAGKAASDHLHALGALSDVSVTGAANGMVVKRVGTAWQAARVLLGDIEGAEATISAIVAAQITELKADAPAALDTFKELAAALGNDPAFVTTIVTALGNRVRVDAVQSFTAGQKAQALANIGAVQQGGGVGQGASKVRIGWDSLGGLKGQVDDSDLGYFFMGTKIAAHGFGTTYGWQLLPSGLIIQWGLSLVNNADYYQNFNIAFPARCYSVSALPIATVAGNQAISVSSSNISRTSFDIRSRLCSDGGGVAPLPNVPILWTAIGN